MSDDQAWFLGSIQMSIGPLKHYIAGFPATSGRRHEYCISVFHKAHYNLLSLYKLTPLLTAFMRMSKPDLSAVVAYWYMNGMSKWPCSFFVASRSGRVPLWSSGMCLRLDEFGSKAVIHVWSKHLLSLSALESNPLPWLDPPDMKIKFQNFLLLGCHGQESNTSRFSTHVEIWAVSWWPILF